MNKENKLDLKSLSERDQDAVILWIAIQSGSHELIRSCNKDYEKNNNQTTLK